MENFEIARGADMSNLYAYHVRLSQSGQESVPAIGACILLECQLVTSDRGFLATSPICAIASARS